MDMAVNFVEPWACDPFVYVIDSETLKDQSTAVKNESSQASIREISVFPYETTLNLYKALLTLTVQHL